MDGVAESSTAVMIAVPLFFISVVQVPHHTSWAKTFGDRLSSLHSFYVIPKLCHSVSKSVTGCIPSRMIQQTVLRPLPFAETLKLRSSPRQRNTQRQCTASMWESSFWGWYLRTDTFHSEDLKDLFQKVGRSRVTCSQPPVEKAELCVSSSYAVPGMLSCHLLVSQQIAR